MFTSKNTFVALECMVHIYSSSSVLWENFDVKVGWVQILFKQGSTKIVPYALRLLAGIGLVHKLWSSLKYFDRMSLDFIPIIHK